MEASAVLILLDPTQPPDPNERQAGDRKGDEKRQLRLDTQTANH